MRSRGSTVSAPRGPIVKQLLQDIANDPREYAGLIGGLVFLFLIWAGLCALAIASWRGTLRKSVASTSNRRLMLAMPPLLFGAAGVLTRIPISIESDDFELHWDLGWFFTAPLLLGALALYFWWRRRKQDN